MEGALLEELAVVRIELAAPGCCPGDRQDDDAQVLSESSQGCAVLKR